MKKRSVWFLSLLVAIVCVFSLAGCGSKAGVYKFRSMSIAVNGQTTEIKAGEKYGEGALSISLSEDSFRLELKDDGSYSFSSASPVLGALFSLKAGTWAENAEDSKKIDLSVGGVVINTVECSGGTITLKIGDNSLVLKK